MDPTNVSRCITIYPKKYAHVFCFAVLCCGYTLTDFPISIRLTSLALWQSNDCPSASKATLMNMDKYFMWIHNERLHNHNQAKHNKTVCIFLGIYCICMENRFSDITFNLLRRLTIHQQQITVYPKKYAHGFVVLCFVVVMQSFIMNSHEVFIHIHQGCFAGTGAIVRLPQCQWSNPDGYGKISQCITTTKHSKAKPVCIFLGIYCTSFYDELALRWNHNFSTSVVGAHLSPPKARPVKGVDVNQFQRPMLRHYQMSNPFILDGKHYLSTIYFETAKYWLIAASHQETWFVFQLFYESTTIVSITAFYRKNCKSHHFSKTSYSMPYRSHTTLKV